MLESERLRYTPIARDDLPWLIEMRSPAAVNRYLGGPEMQSAEALAVRMKFYIESFDKFGFGFCKMQLKSTGELIGTSGLVPLNGTGEIEVGYNLSERFWKKGYGYECAMAWLKYGFETAGLERIVAVAHPDNTGSWRIMEKCGMTYEKTDRHYNMNCVFYGISREEFLGAKSDDITIKSL